jgi:hypothetical protein
MIDLSTDYLGLRLKNPLVPSASPLSKSIDTALRLEDAGAAALVMYSLFEEELHAEDAMLDRFLLHGSLGHGEADGFLPDQREFQGGLERYLAQLHQLKRRLEILWWRASTACRRRAGWRSGVNWSRPAQTRWSSTSITSPPMRRPRAGWWRTAMSNC